MDKKYIKIGIGLLIIMAILLMMWPFNNAQKNKNRINTYVEYIVDENTVSFFKNLVVQRGEYFYPNDDIQAYYELGKYAYKIPAKISTFENYNPLDSLGRATKAYACLSKESMPKENEERQDISYIKPTGWNQNLYESITDGQALYNRCHLIGWYLSGENANWRNLITGTRFFNTEGMLPIENRISNYIKQDKKHVLYLVSPVFEADNLVAYGIVIEAYSVEDKGETINFKIFCPNVQPGIAINYRTGENMTINELLLQSKE